MAEKHFIGFNETVYNGLDKKKKYYVEVDGSGKVFAEEVQIPLSELQQRIIELESNVDELMQCIRRTDAAKLYNVTTEITYDVIQERPGTQYLIGGVDNA